MLLKRREEKRREEKRREEKRREENKAGKYCICRNFKKRKKSQFFKNNSECDFVIPKNQVVQVSWELNKADEKREIKGLSEAMNITK